MADNPDIYMEAVVPIGLGCALDMFHEKYEVSSLLNSLPDIFLNPAEVETAYQTYCKIIDRYQEQPHLLDSYLEPMISTCLRIFRAAETPPTLPLRHLSLKFLRQIFKVRGPKEVVKRMPHEVSDLVPILTFLETLKLEDGTTWESGYVLIMWLSILVINPFHLKLLDGSSDGESISERLRAMCMKAIVINNNVGQAASVLISSFLTRPDMQELYMGPFIDWACNNLVLRLGHAGTRMGAFMSLASLFKHGKREELLKYGVKVLKAVIASDFILSDTLIRKLGTKLLQRVGMMFMKTKLAPWRYQRGCRSLLTNLQASMNTTTATGSGGEPEDSILDPHQYDELSEYSSEIETILDLLLDSLKDKDTIIRWSAAKGIGRVTNRLPRDYGDEVVQSILKGFTSRETSGTWHGGCMALAELGRRGLLLPETLKVTIPVIKKALVYDEIRGNFSVGGHVRDAACYVLWAFARAFEPHIVKPYAEEIASALIITMLFDREVNCRRAASAAFQENVGRQGNIPHGMDIITIADYFTLGVRTETFSKVSLQVAQFPEYIRPMVDHLVGLKFNYYDLSVRELTSQALAHLSRLDPVYVRNLLLDKILPCATTPNVQTAHGAIKSISNVMVALVEMGQFEISPENFKAIKNIAKHLKEHHFKEVPYGYIPLREATCYLIKSCAATKFPVHNDEEILGVWNSVLVEGVSYCAESLREQAAEAFPVFFKEYYYSSAAKREEIRGYLETFCHNLKSNSSDTRMGYAVCIGKLPPCILKLAFPEVMTSLTRCSTSATAQDIEWAEVRRDALNAIAGVFAHGVIPVETVDDWSTGIPINEFDIETIFACFVTGLNDYTTDKRGDVGSWVRVASMNALKHFFISLNKCEVTGNCVGKYLTPERMMTAMTLILKQCIEKIDNVRVHASEVLSTILTYDDPPIHNVPHLSQLCEIFPREFLRTVNWRSSSISFPKFAELLRIEDFTYNLLSGFVLSGGSLSDSVMKDANTAVSNYIIEAARGTGELDRIGAVFIAIFKNNQRNERVTLPLMKFLTQLLQTSMFAPILAEGHETFGVQLSDCIKAECGRTNRVEKIAAGVELLCELMQGSQTLIKTVLRRLVIFLCHVYPRVRTLTAEKLYEALNTYGDSLEGQEQEVDLEGAMAILSDTLWVTTAPAELRPIRNHFCALLNVPVPTLLIKE